MAVFGLINGGGFVEELLRVLSDCCKGGLLILENVGYDFGDIVGQLRF